MKSKLLRFSLIEIFFWMVWASYGAFYATYGLARGYAQSQVSVMLACYFVCAFAGQFVWGSVSDKLRTNKNVFLLGITAGWAILMAMYVLQSPLSYGICYALYGFMMGPMSSLLDTWALKSMDKDISAYGKARGLGSLGYAVWILAVGQLINRIGYIVMPIVTTIMTVITLALAMITADSPQDNEQRGKIRLTDILSILKCPIYLVVLVVIFFVGLSIAPVNNLKIMVLEQVGGDVGTQGVDAFIGCIVQFTMFWFSGAVTFIKPKARMLIGTAAIFTALVIDYTAGAVWVIFIGTCLLYGSYSLILPAAREVVIANIDSRYQTTANGLVDACYSALSGTLALLFAGMIAEAWGVRSMILVTMMISVIPTILTFVVLLLDRKKTA